MEEFSNFNPGVNMVKDITIKDYNHFRGLAQMLTHFKVKRSGGDYYHHFLVIGITLDKDNTDVITVAHYTSSAEIFTDDCQGSGKFIIESVDKNSKLLHYPDNLFLVQNEKYPNSRNEKDVAWGRLTGRLNERDYHLSSNNCEHAIHYILTGESFSEQVDSNRSRADCCGFLVDCKEVGFRTALLVSALGAIAGSLVRRVYVKLIVAAIVSYSIGTKQFIPNCGNKVGSNIIHEADERIKQAESLSIIKKQSGKIHLNETKQHIYSDFVCNLAGQLTEEAVMKTCVATLVVCIGLETIFLYSYVFHSLRPKREKSIIRAREYCRVIIIYVLSGFGSTLLAVTFGYFTFLNLNRPALWYFVVVFLTGLACRYLLTCLSGFLFDVCCCKCCLKCCEDSANCPDICCSGGNICFAVVIVLLLTGMITALAFVLK
ncbi:unnamed protein product [Mytilus coruscus]|uniref:LRAT domain-containing protein n=1 Tax=Mytilus coruscus TaxID=42192 RepID=A0A6J8AY43_MYTCO|nr:unnamed protein product [Mytilus coruscus]